MISVYPTESFNLSSPKLVCNLIGLPFKQLYLHMKFHLVKICTTILRRPTLVLIVYPKSRRKIFNGSWTTLSRTSNHQTKLKPPHNRIYMFAVKIDMINTSEISTAKTTDPYDTYWWLAPRYFEELASRPKYLVAIESGTMLFITLIAFTGNSLICLAILRNPRLRTATNYLIFTLSAQTW